MAKSSGAQTFVTSNSKLLTYALVAGAIYIAYRRGVFARLGAAVSGAAASIGSGVGSRGQTTTGFGGTVTTSGPSPTPTTTSQILASTPRASSPMASSPVTYVPTLPSSSTGGRGYITPIIESSDSKPEADPWMALPYSPTPFYGAAPDARDPYHGYSAPPSAYQQAPDARDPYHSYAPASPSPYYGPAPDARDPYHSYGPISNPSPAIFDSPQSPDARDRNLAAVAERPVYQAPGSDSQRDPGSFTAYDPHFIAWSGGGTGAADNQLIERAA